VIIILDFFNAIIQFYIDDRIHIATQMQINPGDMSDIVNGNNWFALDIFSQISGSQQENVFFSSWSIY
jgi:serine protease inhibitor